MNTAEKYYFKMYAAAKVAADRSKEVVARSRDVVERTIVSIPVRTRMHSSPPVLQRPSRANSVSYTPEQLAIAEKVRDLVTSWLRRFIALRVTEGAICNFYSFKSGFGHIFRACGMVYSLGVPHQYECLTFLYTDNEDVAR